MRKMIIALTPALLAMSSGAFAQTAGWRVSEVSGEVRLVENGRARVATRGALLSSGSTIATGSNARAVIVRGEEFVVISPRSQLRVPAAEAPNRIMQLIEDFGTAVFKIQKKSTPHFGVQTPYLAAVVKGTTFTVTVGPEGGSVQVTEGAVEVSTLDGGAKDLVRSGAIAQVGASDLYRLTVQGETTKVIHSEKGASAGAAKANGPVYSGPSARAVEVRARVNEGRDSVSDATRGLVEGFKSDMAQAEFREQARTARREGANPGWGDGNGKETEEKPAKEEDKGKPGEDGKDKPADGGNGKSDGKDSGKGGKDDAGNGKGGGDHDDGKDGRDDTDSGKDDKDAGKGEDKDDGKDVDKDAGKGEDKDGGKSGSDGKDGGKGGGGGTSGQR